MEIKRYVGEAVNFLLKNEAKKATKFVSDKFVITATRKAFKGKIDKRSRSIDVVLKIGKPNYAERDFIKKCKKAGESFPVKKIQLKFFKK